MPEDPEPSQRLNVRVLPQPNDTVCGPTCLHAVYRFYGETVSLNEVIDTTPELPEGGTLAVHLGCHALARGYSAKIYTNNLQIFDPTWFRPAVDLREKLLLQTKAKPKYKKLQMATLAYLEFMDQGGTIQLEAFTPELLRKYIDHGIPVLAGLSATYLYDCPRELPDGTFDDIAGAPTGHFVVIQGYDQDLDHLLVADPLHNNPMFEKSDYSVELARLLAAIHLGIVTYDANLLIIEKKPDPRPLP
jgi:hypothetical protein